MFVILPLQKRIKYRNSPSEVVLAKNVLNIRNKFTEEHECRSMISIKLLSNFIETAYSPCNFAAYFRNSFL